MISDQYDWLTELIGKEEHIEIGKNCLQTHSSLTTGYSHSKATMDPEDLLRSLEKLLDKVYAPTIWVWKGENPVRVPKEPTLEVCDYLDPYAGCMVAGIGMVVGKMVHKFLLSLGVVHLRWTDVFIPIEDQAWFHKLGGKLD